MYKIFVKFRMFVEIMRRKWSASRVVPRGYSSEALVNLCGLTAGRPYWSWKTTTDRAMFWFTTFAWTWLTWCISHNILERDAYWKTDFIVKFCSLDAQIFKKILWRCIFHLCDKYCKFGHNICVIIHSRTP